MKKEHLQLLTDTRLSANARTVALYVASLGDGEHEVPFSALRRLLNQAGERKVRSAVDDAAAVGWITRREGGRGHHPRLSFTPANSAELSDSCTNLVELNTDSTTNSANLKAPSSSTAATTTTAAPTRGSARDGDLSFQHLRVLLGPHAEVLDRFNCSAAHSDTWPAAVWGLFRPPGEASVGGGTEWSVLAALETREHQVEALAQAMEDFAAAGHVWKPRHFRGFVLSAVQSVQLREKRLAAGVEEPVPRPARSAANGRGQRRPMDEQVYVPSEGFQGFNR